VIHVGRHIFGRGCGGGGGNSPPTPIAGSAAGATLTSLHSITSKYKQSLIIIIVYIPQPWADTLFMINSKLIYRQHLQSQLSGLKTVSTSRTFTTD